MKRTDAILSALLAIASTGAAGVAAAQEMPASVYRVVSHESADPARIDYNTYYAAEGDDGEAPKQQAPIQTPPTAVNMEPTSQSEPSDTGGSDEAAQPWTLQGWYNPCHEESFTWGGWIDGGVTYNQYGPGNQWNGPVGFNDRNEAMLNQFDVFAEQKVDTKGCGWDFGGRVDLMWGRDALWIQSTGLELHQDGSRHWNGQRFYGLALTQAYGEIGYNDLDVKLGKMVTPLEYEVIDARANFFYSHSYGFLYAVPFTHTGGIGTWKYGERLTLLGGVVNGWDRFDGLSDQAALLTGFVYKGPCEKGTLTFNLISGNEFNETGTETTNRTAYSLVFDYKINECLEYVLVHDLGVQEDYFRNGNSAEWYGVNNYLLYSINDCWKAGMRFEWFRDDDGVRVTGVGPTAGDNPLFPGGAAGNFYEMTVGLNWIPNANVRVRPELRYDWFSGTGTAPFDNNTKDHQLTLAIDGIFTF